MRRPVGFWLITGWLCYAVIPWYAGQAWGVPFFLSAGPDAGVGPALWAGLAQGRWWLVPIGAALAFATAATLWPLPNPGNDPARAAVHRAWRGLGLALGGAFGLAALLAQGFGIGLRGWTFSAGEALFGIVDAQTGIGLGAWGTGLALLFLLTYGLADRGAFKGDGFTAGAVGLAVAGIGVFVFLPVFYVLAAAVVGTKGDFSFLAFLDRLTTRSIWSLDCVVGGRRCGVVWNSLLLAVLTGFCTTLLGLGFALVAVRTGFRAKKLLRLLTVLPIITPPFVIGLALILLFGRNGIVTSMVSTLFDIPPSRWIYGLPGVLLTQVLAFTPIAFLVMIGVVQGVSPSVEEAAQTLRAGRWQTFRTVTLPLIRPGLANAFLIGFIESLADFGNPLILGGNFDVLSTKIFFSVVGAQNDPGMAATLGIILLTLCLTAFFVQRLWLGKKSYTSVGGKGDGGQHALLPRRVSRLAYAVVLPWAGFTAVLYGMILYGGFVETWGRNHTLTLRHYATAFSAEWVNGGILWTGRAWASLFTTLEISALAAPITAAVGLLTAYLLVRQRFTGRGAFEFATMLSFAIPGTVIGISYIMAFNQPPIELTGGFAILIICFVFRNMPVAIRAGIAAMSQIDRSLDECSQTLGASSATTLRRVILPLLRPAIVASLVYSFVRAITSISAVIFLVSAKYELATAYIVGRVEQGDFGLAVAYCSALIVLMAVAIGVIQLLVGERRIGRRPIAAPVPQAVEKTV